MSDMDEKRNTGDEIETTASPGRKSAENNMDRYLTNKASAFRYPPTPDISTVVRNKLVEGALKDNGRGAKRLPAYKPRRAWVATALTALVIIASLLSVPSVRAFVSDVYIGVVHIVRGGDNPDLNVPTVTPGVPWNPRLTGEIDLGSAYSYVSDPSDIKLPTYPADLGLPDHIYYQYGSSLLLYVWLEPNDASKARLALYQIPPNVSVSKVVSDGIATESLYINANAPISDEKKTHGYWIEGPTSFALQYTDENENHITNADQLLPGNTLVWDDMDSMYTYKLVGETDKTEAVKIANSLKALSNIPKPLPTATPVSPVSKLDLYGQKDLYQLESAVGFRVKVPAMAEKPELIQPDRVYLQGSVGYPDFGQSVIMVWLVPDRRDDIRMVLTQGLWDSTAGIDTTTGAVSVTVNGKPARWVAAPQNVYVQGADGKPVLAQRQYVTGSHALIWQDDALKLRYRLETTLSMAEAIRIAEALK